jgi:hypothetical protein
MQYNKLTKLINRYPQTGNYITIGVGQSSLFGLYADVNKIDFKLELLDNVTIVPNTKFRTLVAIYENKNDKTPQYYTSEIYHKDLSTSIYDANPYFVNASFNPSFIVNIYLDEIVNSMSVYKEAELKSELIFLKNSFIFFNNVGISTSDSIVKNNLFVKKPSSNNSILDNTLIKFDNDISKLENAISNVSSDVIRKGFFGSIAEVKYGDEVIRAKPQFNRNKQIEDIQNQLIEKLNILKESKTEVESNRVNFEKLGLTKVKSEKLKTENIKLDKFGFFNRIKNKSVIAPSEKDIIEINGMFIDCILLVQYIDWVLTEPNLNEIESGGVIPAELLLEYEEKVKETPVDVIDNNNNTINTDPSTVGNIGTGKYYEYEIIRLAVPAALESSIMTFKASDGTLTKIQTSDYGYVGTYCIEENTFNGNYTIYQKTQLAPCNIPGSVNNGGGTGRQGGRRGGIDYYDNQNRNIEYIDRQRDFQNVQ